MVVHSQGGRAHEDQVGLAKDQLDGRLGRGVGHRGAGFVEHMRGELLHLVLVAGLQERAMREGLDQLQDGLLQVV